MQPVGFDIEYTTPRDRLSSALRIFYALPHLIILSILSYFGQLLSLIQWFIILFTGKRNEGIFKLSKGVLDWWARGYSYADLMYDKYPNFAFEGAGEPVHLTLEYQAEANRLTNAFRIILAIPAVIILMVIGIGAFVILIASWFAIVITGVHPKGMFDFLLKFHRYAVRTNAYVSLLTDTYPKFE